LTDFRDFLDLLNETLTTAIVVVASSMLLYNLSRNLRNRVARASGFVLFCVTTAYISDVLFLLGPEQGVHVALLRFQWVGLAFIPAATFHLSDALLDTTGLPSRGRRRRVTRILYTIAFAFLIQAAFSDRLIWTEIHSGGISMRAGSTFWLYMAYFVPTNAVAFINVHRARQRCLTRSTKRRMVYLEIAMLMPGVGIFPYSVLMQPGDELSIGALMLVNVANFTVVLTLLFLSYPLSFFGSEIPDRVVKSDLLRMMLLGPATGLLALVVILYTGPMTEWFSPLAETLMPFVVVAAILIWQWSVDIALPWLDRKLIYRDEDDAQLAKLDRLGERLLTHTDMRQLMDAVLTTTCDYLQVNRAFIALLIEPTTNFMEAVGDVPFTLETLADEALSLLEQSPRQLALVLHPWEGYWLIALYSRRINIDPDHPLPIIGMMGIEARSGDNGLTDDETGMLSVFVKRAARILDDMLLQNEVYAALEGLLPQIAMTRRQAAEVEYRAGRTPMMNGLPKREQLVVQVHAALRHYWGGPGLSRSRLIELNIVQDALPENESNPARALRAVLLIAIESQRPEGEPDLKDQAWLLYNILKLRFVDKRKARETATRLYMSEANLYRKQNIAIEAVVDAIMEMEQNIYSVKNL